MSSNQHPEWDDDWQPAPTSAELAEWDEIVAAHRAFFEVEPPTVIDSVPPEPVVTRPAARNVWERRFAEARARGGSWVRVLEPMTRSSASQIASDIRRIGHRDPATIRVKGFGPHELWDARFGNDPTDPDLEHFYVWLRWIETAW